MNIARTLLVGVALSAMSPAASLADECIKPMPDGTYFYMIETNTGAGPKGRNGLFSAVGGQDGGSQAFVGIESITDSLNSTSDLGVTKIQIFNRWGKPVQTIELDLSGNAKVAVNGNSYFRDGMESGCFKITPGEPTTTPGLGEAAAAAAAAGGVTAAILGSRGDGPVSK